jgi:hypothetical protein
MEERHRQLWNLIISFLTLFRSCCCRAQSFGTSCTWSSTEAAMANGSSTSSRWLTRSWPRTSRFLILPRRFFTKWKKINFVSTLCRVVNFYNAGVVTRGRRIGSRHNLLFSLSVPDQSVQVPRRVERGRRPLAGVHLHRKSDRSRRVGKGRRQQREPPPPSRRAGTGFSFRKIGYIRAPWLNGAW